MEEEFKVVKGRMSERWSEENECRARLLKMCSDAIIDIKVLFDVLSISADFADSRDLILLKVHIWKLK